MPHISPSTPHISPSTPHVSALNDAVCIRVSGADAGEFLRAQLARDPPPLVVGADAIAAAEADAEADVIAETAADVMADAEAHADVMADAEAHADAMADADRSVLAAWLDARGRVRALFRVVARDHDYVLLAERETAAAVLAKLRMFVLRSRVVLALEEDWQAAAVVGRAHAIERKDPVEREDSIERKDAVEPEDPVQRKHPVEPEDALPQVDAGAQAHAAARRATTRWLRVGPELVYVVGPRSEVADLAARFETADPNLVELEEIRLGLPKLGAALTERYVPQMLNLDLLGAVAFDKGCYPGQEVVARLKYRGDVKRRVRRFACAAPATLPAPGDEIVDAAGAPAGEVVRAARSDGGVELLAVVQLEAAASGLRLTADPAAILTPRPLPFDVPENGV